MPYALVVERPARLLVEVRHLDVPQHRACLSRHRYLLLFSLDHVEARLCSREKDYAGAGRASHYAEPDRRAASVSSPEVIVAAPARACAPAGKPPPRPPVAAASVSERSP